MLRNDLGAVKDCVRKGANVEAINEHSGWSLLMYVCHCESDHESELQSLQCIKYLLEHGASAHTAHRTQPPLYFGISYRNVSAVEEFMRHGAEFESSRNYSFNTPIADAIHMGYIPVIETLLKNGSSANQLDQDNRSPLIYTTTYNLGEVFPGKRLKIMICC